MATYEQPLNERIRTFLRLEQLFQRLDYHQDQSSTWDIQGNIARLLEILDISSRSDLKREAIKELERQSASLAALNTPDNEDNEVLEQQIQIKRDLIEKLHSQQGQVALHLKSNAFLSSLRQRSTVAGSVFRNDLAMYHHWLEISNQACFNTIDEWLEPLDHYRAAVEHCLKSIRESSSWSKETAESGFYQSSLDSTKSIQLVCIELLEEGSIFPEISAGKLRISTRFMCFKDVYSKPEQSSDTISFSLGVCAI